MKILNQVKLRAILQLFTYLIIFTLTCFFATIVPAAAATTPNLGQATSFGILSGTYTNTVGGTTINGDLGYTTGPGTAPTVNGTTHQADGTYNQAGIDQDAALTNLNSQPCTHTFPAGPVDLATDTSHGTIGIYAPGVYCTTTSSAASIGAGGITLSGSGTYIFRINGALTTTLGSVVTAVSACDVFWTPTEATTLGANSTFVGTDIDASGITLGGSITWVGKALGFGGTISTAGDTITTPTCSTPTPTPIPTSTPVPSPTPTILGNSTLGSLTANSVNASPGIDPCNAAEIKTIPIILESRRISPTSIFLSWGPFAKLNTFNIRYGLTNGNFLYNTNVTGFSTTLNDLPANDPIWVQVAARNNCSIGTYGKLSLIGEPGLPDAGFAPHQSDLSGYVLTNLLIFSLLVLHL